MSKQGLKCWSAKRYVGVAGSHDLTNSTFLLQIVLSPVEVAIEDMRVKISKLKEVLSNPQDTKLLQMQLQGGIATSVNQGAYAIAHAFLGEVKPSEQNHYHQQLRMCFREFVKL